MVDWVFPFHVDFRSAVDFQHLGLFYINKGKRKKNNNLAFASGCDCERNCSYLSVLLGCNRSENLGLNRDGRHRYIPGWNIQSYLYEQEKGRPDFLGKGSIQLS